MVVRFNSAKVRENTSIDIGVEHEPHEKGAISEVEMIVSEARRNSGIPIDAVQLTTREEAELREDIIREQEESEPGPELVLGEDGSGERGQAEKDKERSGQNEAVQPPATEKA